MQHNLIMTDCTIRGRCSLFLCRDCRTKYGWEHQLWCPLRFVTQPSCKDCRYYWEQNGECTHPSKKQGKGELPYEET